jgi:hypothetical protein
MVPAKQLFSGCPYPTGGFPHIPDAWYLRPEWGVSAMGAQWTQGNVASKLRTFYAQLRMHFNYRVHHREVHNPERLMTSGNGGNATDFYFGPLLAYRLRAEYTRERSEGQNGQSTLRSSSEEISGDLPPLDAGLSTGVDFCFASGFFVGGLFTFGLVPIEGKDRFPSNGRHFNAQASVGFQFH